MFTRNIRDFVKRIKESPNRNSQSKRLKQWLEGGLYLKILLIFLFQQLAKQAIIVQCNKQAISIYRIINKDNKWIININLIVKTKQLINHSLDQQILHLQFKVLEAHFLKQFSRIIRLLPLLSHRDIQWMKPP